jgi:hypothetical protein
VAEWICSRCDKPLELKKTVFNYLGHSFTHAVPTCPQCGDVFIPPELAEGKMAEVEEQLEDK